MDVWTIVSAVLGLVAIVGGGSYLKVKGKLGQVKNLGKEAVDVLIVAVNAVDDDKITAEEVAAIKKEAKEAAAAFKTLIGK